MAALTMGALPGMKIASITLPKPDEGPHSPKYMGMTTAHKTIQLTLLGWCQGYSRVDVLGAWSNGDNILDEQGYRYEFTSPDTQIARDELVALAYRIKTISDEEAIFIVHANGEAEIVR